MRHLTSTELSGIRNRGAIRGWRASLGFLGRVVRAWACLLTSLVAALAGAAERCRAAARPGRGNLRRRLGQYTLEEKIGEGGMGIVYRARDTRLGRPAAVKFLRPERVRDEDRLRFAREVHYTRQLRHPNIVALYEAGESATGAYYAMEYLDGVDLQTLVEREGPQSSRRVAHLLAQLCGALAEAHGRGLIHRDIKPANVAVCSSSATPDLVKLLDFGLIHDLSNGFAQGEQQRVVGTPLYLSPEALTTPHRIDGRSDLYSVGAVGYYLLTGAPPFSGGSLLEVCARHLHSTPVPPSSRVGTEIDPELESLILACLEKSMQARPRDAAGLRDALLRIAQRADGPGIPAVRSAA